MPNASNPSGDGLAVVSLLSTCVASLIFLLVVDATLGRHHSSRSALRQDTCGKECCRSPPSRGLARARRIRGLDRRAADALDVTNELAHARAAARLSVGLAPDLLTERPERH